MGWGVKDVAVGINLVGGVMMGKMMSFLKAGEKGDLGGRGRVE